MKTICVVTGTRAEYGLLKPLLKKIEADEELILKLVVTGMHLSTEFGYTVNEIEEDGFLINKKIEMLIDSNTSSAITKSMGIELIGFSDYFEDTKIDLILLLGDRYEILIAAIAAMIFRIPIAHIHGGELTEGAFDEAMRHSISKMSMLHFTTTEEYRNRVIQLGEQPTNVFCVGSLGVENTEGLKLLSKEELKEKLGIVFEEKLVIVTYHPVTLEKSTAVQQFQNLLEALDKFEDMKIIFTKANADTDGRKINQMIDEYVKKHSKTMLAFDSMGQINYLSVLQYCDAVIGNSSSGIIEVPSFEIPTVNIGDRQKGRVQAQSVINCSTETLEIKKAIETALGRKFRSQIIGVKNPYKKEGTSEAIMRNMKHFLEKETNLKKVFYNLFEEKE